MSDEYDSGFESLKALKSWYLANRGDRNEATTRSHLIDALLYDVLRWHRSSVTQEDHQGGQYTDYTLHAPRPLMILEAKREGTYFEIPVGSSARVRSLASLVRGNQELQDAVTQVAGYCQRRGVPSAAVSNGHQLVAFVAVRLDAVPPLDGRALVFTSFDDLVEGFLDLWQHLSPAGVAEGRLTSTLIGDSGPAVPPKLSASIQEYPGIQRRNVLQTDLQILSELVLEDVTRMREIEPRFLAECYSPSGALSQYSLLGKNILQARYAALHDPKFGGPVTEPATNKGGVSADLFADSLSRRPVLLIGDVGVGKTAFWRHLMLVESAELTKDSIVLYVDFGTKATLAVEFREFLLGEIARQLREQYDVDVYERNFIRGVYNLDVERFREGLYADLRESNPNLYREKEIEHLQTLVANSQEHLRRSLEHLVKGRRKQVVLFIDNTDQRSEDVQQEAFLAAQELAEHWPATVFVALRPETFHRSQREGALSGYHPKAFTISPPRVDIVLEKRLKFALKLASGEISIEALGSSVAVNLKKLESVLHVFLRSIHRNRELIEAIDNIASGNVRRALDLVKSFFGSGHVDTQKILEIEDSQSNGYVIPLHEFHRAVIFGESEHYDPSRSPVANLFDVRHPDPKEHFLLPLLLEVTASPSAKSTKEGFVETDWVYEKLQGHRFTVGQIDVAMMRASDWRLIETEARAHLAADQPAPHTIRITAVGAYHVKRLVRMFTYVDAVIVDTPVLDPDVRGNMEVVEFIHERLDRAEAFVAYLDGQWRNSPLQEGAFSWPENSEALSKDIKRIRSRIRR